MEKIDINPKDLIPNSWNTNVMSPENEEKLKESLKRFGFVRPILCREVDNNKYEIIGGAHRVEIAVEMGFTTVPVINLGKMEDKKAKEISLLDNARYGTDDGMALAELIDSLDIRNEISEFLPFTNDDLDILFSGYDLDLDELEEEDIPETPEPLKKAPKTHQIMRFKVPVDDAEQVSDIIEKVQRSQGFSSSDALTNAGDTLVWIVNKAHQEGVL